LTDTIEAGRDGNLPQALIEPWRREAEETPPLFFLTFRRVFRIEWEEVILAAGVRR